ncbi:acyl-CoA dehydrogenase family protein [Actinomadura viridis]|uniref:Alkylation response protein AidB-like acyl-CoA dehydrogenase n=1 Tax=Actinomadura viridis TaxID=58110 RepID=A0A931GKX4_9ACTN|nr:acyl-CoA dehydrogenase family protein [Actinomadura viridis]MBG6090827.1 alkylation response protein AidB-like acyl-CoA dehydrogenase [Actinomadura viridis]
MSEELQELRKELRRFFADKSPSAEVRRLMETAEGYDPAVWAQMAGQLGLQGLAVPEELGGAGFGMREVAVVMEEMGRALVCSPYLSSSVLAATALLASGDAGRAWLPGIADGTTRATLAWSEGDGWDPGAVATTAREYGGGWVLDGTKSYVLDGHTAGVVLVTARAGDGPALFAVDGDAPGFTRTPLPTLDQTRRLARLDLDGVPARLVLPEAGAALERALDTAAVALAAEQLGGARRMLEMTVEYAKVRRQFGRPIGGFQAIKHRCADMFVLVESACSAVAHAAAVADERPEELPAAAALAKAYCSDAYFEVAGEAIQIHGGIGFTWEHDAHLYFKRARSSQELFGPPARHRRRLADLVGI